MSLRPVVSIAYVIAVGMTAVSIALFWVRPAVSESPLRVGDDYATFHGAASLVADGRGADVYDPPVLAERIAETIAFPNVEDNYFGHFPFFVLAFVPLTVLPFNTAFLVFTVLGLIVFAVALSRMGVSRVGAVLVLVTLSFPGFYTLDLGQMGLLVAALMFGVYLMLHSDRMFVAGILIGLLAFKVPYAIGIGCWWILRPVYYRKAIGGAAISSVGLAFAGLLVPGGWAAYWALTTDGPRIDRVARSGFSLFEMLWAALGNDMLATVLWVLVSIAVLVGFYRTIHRLDHCLEPSMALAVVMGLLISPRTGWYDWVLLVVPAVLLWQTYPRLRSQLVAAGAWVYFAGAVSIYLATKVDSASGVFVQSAPLVLVGVTGWFVRLLLADSEAPGDALATDIHVPESVS